MTHDRFERNYVEQEGYDVARLLDSGRSDAAAERLRQDLRSFSAKEFQDIIKIAARFEDPNSGANLVSERRRGFGDEESIALKIVSGNNYGRYPFDRDNYRHRYREIEIAEIGSSITPSRGARLNEQLPANVIASLMDRGDLETAAAGLRAEASYGSSRDFQRLLREIQYYERPGLGADLSLSRRDNYSWRQDDRDKYQISMTINDRRHPYFGYEEPVANITYWARPTQNWMPRPRPW